MDSPAAITTEETVPVARALVMRGCERVEKAGGHRGRCGDLRPERVVGRGTRRG